MAWKEKNINKLFAKVEESLETNVEAQELLLHANALLEVSNKIGALLLAALQTVRLQAVHHFHFEFAAFVVGLMIDQATSQIREG